MKAEKERSASATYVVLRHDKDFNELFVLFSSKKHDKKKRKASEDEQTTSVSVGSFEVTSESL